MKIKDRIRMAHTLTASFSFLGGVLVVNSIILLIIGDFVFGAFALMIGSYSFYYGATKRF